MYVIITILDEPSSPPSLQSNKMKYSAGDLINVSCITRESYPAVNMSWFLNNQTVFFPLIIQTSVIEIQCYLKRFILFCDC